LVNQGEGSNVGYKKTLLVIQKFGVILLSSGLGMIAGGMLATSAVALLNYLAVDGPIFPAPLVAFVIVAPVSFILFLFCGMGLIYEWITRRRLKKAWLWIGGAGGIVAGLIPYSLAIAPYQVTTNHQALLVFAGLGLFMGLVVSGSLWFMQKWTDVILARFFVRE
jgi:hypothetical protein